MLNRFRMIALIVTVIQIVSTGNRIARASEVTQIPLVPAQGCNRETLGISCCSEGFTTGDNENDGAELFIQENQYEGGCVQTCKKRQPTSIGATVSLTQKYSNGEAKCWCEFKSARLDATSRNYQTCLFNGYQNRFAVFPSSVNRYIRPRTTVLKLKEDPYSWSGDDSTVTDLDGNKWFEIEGPWMSARQKRKLFDNNGTVVAGYQKKFLSMHSTSYITIQDPDRPGEVLVVASVTKASSVSWVANADIYLHQPAVSLSSVSHAGLTPDIKVEGDIRGKTFDFMMQKDGSPVRIAQIVRKFQLLTIEKNTYYLEISPNVDVAFISLCAFALDEMFKEYETE